jgi:hypothetical protein
MNNRNTIRDWVKKYNNGDFNQSSCAIQVEAGWYDWFCKDSSLKNKTKALAPKVKKISKSPKINIDTMYVLFKNNCPLYGNLYDDFRICDLETDDVIFTIIPKHGQQDCNGWSEVWGRENDFDGPLVSGTWEDVLNFFNV